MNSGVKMTYHDIDGHNFHASAEWAQATRHGIRIKCGRDFVIIDLSEAVREELVKQLKEGAKR